ncbi:MAG TPA: hypothetical protein VE623_23550, partial [Acidimicrobiales bacterium]|nr:hypothetical protein [Acidimicrobiales bacterium]
MGPPGPEFVRRFEGCVGGPPDYLAVQAAAAGYLAAEAAARGYCPDEPGGGKPTPCWARSAWTAP